MERTSNSTGFDSRPTTLSMGDVVSTNTPAVSTSKCPTARGTDDVVLAVVVVMTVIVILCLLGVVLSYFLRHKGTYRTQEGKFQPGIGQGTALQAVEDNCEGLEENMKEYFL
uniref:Glycophorin-C-like isoform X1 n=2 Tax=Petromyzon marinus TaxID=7757 RepID=A0AAJ7SZP0_PETMA|nr:glycophorin-C-like isoform X1 [Petromyzon marinus]